MPTVKDVTFALLRKLGLTTIVGNPGSTEETFLKNFPADFRYVMALQEASVVGVADGLSQGLRKPVIVNVHTGAGLGNAMGTILTAYQNKTPLILTAGQQTREMLLLEPLLTNIEAVNMPRPWVKWSYEPARAEDVPGAFMRAYATAMQQPSGPVFLSLPLDDWDKEMPETDPYRTIATRQGPDPVRLAEFAARLDASRNPVLVYGADIARAGAWDAGIALAEQLQAPVWAAPFCERTPFPEDHPLFAGALPAAIGPLSEKLAGHDLLTVVGAPVFRYYPYVPGRYLPDGAALIQVSDDPGMTAKAPVGDSLVADAGLFLTAALPLLTRRPPRGGAPLRPPVTVPDMAASPLTPAALFATLRACCPEDFILAEESPSNVPQMQDHFRIDKPDAFYTFASGGLGWTMPAAVGLALAEKESGRNRPVLCLMGDGSFQYSVQSLYTAVQEKAHVIYVVLQNEEYGILKEFAVLEETPHVPGLDLPGLDIVSLAKGYGARTTLAKTAADVTAAFKNAVAAQGASVIVVPITRQLNSLL
ncbi:benzoylformate decarboxylase [Chelatococcus asaccharovorans]|uniref:Benzoylformate decarboxylase n=1 Tax=Chelatococcus asaccharovorans TaxID=28210 RepID=A0A2V3UFM9_9HYPH|nr:benzoylformate decarboxylase [Chelatococcus asaccharovorans]MBS7707369.1 benzoylformate decarboxylase [Chelatococcus asaccharovorans]PXW63551.1 benzoylformate decarboxylase [Chelatococcus asaccharovorans]